MHKCHGLLTFISGALWSISQSWMSSFANNCNYSSLLHGLEYVNMLKNMTYLQHTGQYLYHWDMNQCFIGNSRIFICCSLELWDNGQSIVKVSVDSSSTSRWCYTFILPLLPYLYVKLFSGMLLYCWSDLESHNRRIQGATDVRGPCNVRELIRWDVFRWS